MSEGERRRSGVPKRNVEDELDEATDRKHKRDASKEAVEDEEKTGGTGGTKENVRDEWDESQKHQALIDPD